MVSVTSENQFMTDFESKFSVFIDQKLAVQQVNKNNFTWILMSAPEFKLSVHEKLTI